MISEIGHYALLLCCCVSFCQFVLGLRHAENLRVQQFCVQCAKAQFYLLSLAILALGYAFYSNEFSLHYVASHSNSLLPWYYRLSALWGGHEGSLLLWLYILSAWGASVAWRSQDLPANYLTRVLAVLGYISTGFALFTLYTSNPFLKQADIPFDGRDLNPLLQDIGLIFHPPLLYTGYVGFAVAFAFVVAGLWQGQLDSLWLRRSRSWTLAAWLTLTLGIALGSFWAYYELGWGGWWFWDPVENASLMPWLIGTALLHALPASEKRGLFMFWTPLLAILAFSLSLMGTFLVRSGVLTSVHAFASDPTRGVFILTLLAAIMLPALLLLIFRSHKLTPVDAPYALLSRETGLLANNWLFAGACLIVFVGTLYPLLADMLNLGKISVGAPYFNRMIVPLALISFALLGVAPLLKWRAHRLNQLLIWLGFNAVFASCLTGAVYVMSTYHKFKFLLTIWLLAFAFAAIVADYLMRIKKRGIKGIKARAAHTGMLLAHLGYLATGFGITATELYSTEKDMRIKVGQSISLADYQLNLQTLTSHTGANYQATQARFVITRHNAHDFLVVLTPEKRQYFSSAMPMTESARYSRPTHDLYLALGEKLNDEEWAIRVQHKPFISWIWLGALIMALAGMISMTDRAYRLIKHK